VKTGDRSLDETTAAGLFGLSYQLGQRTSVEPDEPHGIDLARDSLELYPLIYYAVPRNAKALPPAAVAKVNAYLRAGGAFFVDTRDAAPDATSRRTCSSFSPASMRRRCSPRRRRMC
jgi:hypothetical protein